MANVTLIVAPNAIAEITGVAAIKISARYFYACDKELKTLFSCKRKASDGKEITENFLQLAALIAERALKEAQESIDVVDKVINATTEKKV
jgi:3-oxoacyl-[acyl-carrier-protein] synthase III